MNIIKLNATSSTNTFLKEMCGVHAVENFTVVTAKLQTEGRGQRGSIWNSESDKNLTFSVFVKNVLDSPLAIFDLNVLVTISLFETLTALGVPDLKIKWPNDIMSANSKISGILIENSFRTDGEITSIVGIGLNVNQKEFEGLDQATSILLKTNVIHDLDQVLKVFMENLISKFDDSGRYDAAKYWSIYKKNLFKRGIPMVFENPSQFKFMGIIRDVTRMGQLVVEVESGEHKEFALKEIKMRF